jgi:hypothetical protein
MSRRGTFYLPFRKPPRMRAGVAADHRRSLFGMRHFMGHGRHFPVHSPPVESICAVGVCPLGGLFGAALGGGVGGGSRIQ